MTRNEYFKLRGTLYKAVGELGTMAELKNEETLDSAYNSAQTMLDAIDDLGVQFGYLDRETLEELYSLNIRY
jgi:hypothetical protein